MAISVIISNFNGSRFLPRLLETLKSQQNVTTEIIIVDRQSTDGSQELLAQVSDIKVIEEPPLSGLVAGYAAGARAAKHEHLFFANEDMWFDPACLSHLERHISPERKIGAADPWQWTYDGRHWIHGGVRFRKRLWDLNSPHPRRAFDFTVPLRSGERIPFPCAGAFLIHREMYDDIGGWDTTFFLDHEDVDLFVRAWQRDWRCVTVPEAKVYHAIGASNGQRESTGRMVSERRYISSCSNRTVIGLKYFSGFSWFWVPAGDIFMILRHALMFRWKRLGWDLRSVALTFRRLKAIREFRSSERKIRRQKPGEKFFLQEEMLLSQSRQTPEHSPQPSQT